MDQLKIKYEQFKEYLKCRSCLGFIYCKTKNIHLMGSSQKRRRAGKNCEEECYLEEDKNIIKIFCLKSELL